MNRCHTLSLLTAALAAALPDSAQIHIDPASPHSTEPNRKNTTAIWNETEVDTANRQAWIADRQRVGYPVMVRPDFVLGGRAMEIVHEPRDLERYMREAVKVSNDSPVLLDRFLNDAVECEIGRAHV